MSRSPPPSPRILKVYIEVFTGFSHVFHPDDLHNTLLSQGCALEAAPSVRTVGGIYIPRTGRGWGDSNCLGPTHRSTRGPVPSVTFSNTLAGKRNEKEEGKEGILQISVPQRKLIPNCSPNSETHFPRHNSKQAPYVQGKGCTVSQVSCPVLRVGYFLSCWPQSIKRPNPQPSSPSLYPNTHMHIHLWGNPKGDPEQFPRNFIFPTLCVQRTMSHTRKKYVYINRYIQMSVRLQQTWTDS